MDRLSASSIDDYAQKQLLRWGGFGCHNAIRSGMMTIPELFGAKAADDPDAVALAFGKTSLTYAALDAASNRLARWLIERGVRPESVVAVMMPRTVDLIVVLLGVLKAGGVYLPIDPGYPAERIEFMLADAAPLLAVTVGDYRNVLEGCGLPVELLDAPSTATRVTDYTAGPLAVTELWGRLHPSNSAYLIYTSGSTGIPKGVTATHEGVADLVSDPQFGSAAHSRVLVHSPTVFDASTYEMWVPLLRGGTAVLAPPGRADVAVLANTIDSAEVTAAFLTTRLFELFAAERPELFDVLHEVWTGGEEMAARTIERVVTSRTARVVHVYGPTEATTFATSCVFLPGQPVGDGPVSIGGPMLGAGVLVLDSDMRLSPMDTAGELYIAGSGLARGYLGRAGLTAARFVADPFGGPGDRVYRTGDVVRWRGDGELQFLGRVDDQVKVRGFRIEPGEIESALVLHRHVERAAVIVRDTATGRQLVGYVTPAVPSEQVDAEALRTYLVSRLPEYMVPAAIVVVDDLPLTINGKLDRAALPEPDFTSSAEYRAPRTSAELAIAAAFSEVLGAERVGLDDDFFALGGYSLLAARLIRNLRLRLGADFTVTAIFESPTPGQLAKLLDSPGGTTDV